MTRNLKALGLALVAVFAIGAMTASAASATDLFTATQSKAWVTGVSHDNKFTVPSASSDFTCTTSKFTGTVVSGASSANALANYTGVINETPHETKCTASIGKVTVHMNDCEYVLSGETTGSDNGTDATVSIVCPVVGGVTQEITITGPLGCVIHIPSQTPTSGGVTYENLPNHTGGAAVKITATATGITYKATNCIGFAAHGNDAVYNGTVTVTGYEHSGGTMTAPTEGSQIGVSVS